MSFSPFARFRNFTVDNLKVLLQIYPDMSRKLSWNEAIDMIESDSPGYKRTAYQQACQFGLEDRGTDTFRIQSYLYSFNDSALEKYVEFWLKTYYAPNPYVNSDDSAMLIYCELAKEILLTSELSVDFYDFFNRRIGGKSDDILLNALKTYGSPLKYDRNKNLFYIEKDSAEPLKKEIDFIEKNFPIPVVNDRAAFFDRYSYEEFCKYYDIDTTIDSNKIKLHKNIKDAARQVIDTIYRIDEFNGIRDLFVNGTNIKIDTSNFNMEGNPLRYVFIGSNSAIYDGIDESKARVFSEKVYNIPIGDGTIAGKLSTDWKYTKIGEGGDGNCLGALIAVVNCNYSDFLEIKEESSGFYIYFKEKEFKYTALPKTFKDNFTRRYITSLLAKPFVILTGNSGTGKTRIAKQFAQFLEKKVDGRKNWLIVPVGADWTDNTKMLGFYNPLDKQYVSTPTLDFILLAEKNPREPFFLILDEMNLSHVERYFSDFLSAMESDEDIPLYKISDDTTNNETTNIKIPEKIKIPKNLFVTGTVNIDETTYMFSPKVLDRANVVEFKPEKEDILKLMISPSEFENIEAVNDGSAESFVALAAKIRNGKCNVENEQLSYVKSFLDSIYEDLQENGFEFAYRTVKEMRQYLAASYEIQKDNFNIISVIDEQIVQKLLPKLYGDRKQIGKLLDSLEVKCKALVEEGTTEEMTLSLKKIEQMKKRLDKYQYASFM